MVERRAIDPPARQPSADATALVEHEHAAARHCNSAAAINPAIPAPMTFVRPLFSRVIRCFILWLFAFGEAMGAAARQRTEVGSRAITP